MNTQNARARPDNPRDIFIYELPRPIWIHVGRIVADRGLERFLELRLPGSKVIIGDGPDRQRLQSEFSHCLFVGYKFGDELATYLAGADVFVHPARTDEFGLVMLEAVANGLPIAALPALAPAGASLCGVRCALDDDLGYACEMALSIGRKNRDDDAANDDAARRLRNGLARRATDAADALGSVSGAHP